MFSGCLYVLFKLPIYFQRDIARFAEIVVDAVVTHFVVFKIAFVKQVVGNQANLQVFAGRVFHVGMPKRVAALFHIAQAAGFALRAYTAADRPFAAAPRQIIAGMQPENVFGRVAAEICALQIRRYAVAPVFAAHIFAVVERVACKDFPVFGEAA